jgi:hypothetical protein
VKRERRAMGRGEWRGERERRRRGTSNDHHLSSI